MALLQGCCRDLHESAGLLQSLDILCTTVTHTGAETAQQLEYGIFHAALVSHTAFNTFGNQFLRILLEVTILTAVLHGCDGTHATVYLVFSTLEQLVFSRALLTSCEHGTHHTYVTTGCNSLGDISGILNTTISNDGNTIFLCHAVAIHDSGYLRNTDTCNDTGGTDGTGADTYLNRICAGLDQGTGSITGSHVTCDYLQIGIFFLDHLQAVQYVLGMTMCGIQYNNINLGCYQSCHTIQYVGGDTYTGAAEQSALGILGCQRIFDGLLNIFDGDQTL